MSSNAAGADVDREPVRAGVGPMYPPPLGAVFAVSLFYALATRGQLQSA